MGGKQGVLKGLFGSRVRVDVPFFQMRVGLAFASVHSNTVELFPALKFYMVHSRMRAFRSTFLKNLPNAGFWPNSFCIRLSGMRMQFFFGGAFALALANQTGP